MESNISIFFIIEIIGTVAFASSGALVAIKQRLDLLGVVVLGVTTAVGGGMLRDIILGIVPPSLFMNPVYVYAAFLTAMVLFILAWLNQQILESRYISAYEKMMNLFDAVGLGAFTVTASTPREQPVTGNIISFPSFWASSQAWAAVSYGIYWQASPLISCASMYTLLPPLPGPCAMSALTAGSPGTPP